MKTNKRKYGLCGLLCIALLLVSFAFIQPKETQSASAAANELEPFYFSQTSSTTCSIGLADYSLKYAFIPETFGDLTVTEIISYGFAFSWDKWWHKWIQS